MNKFKPIITLLIVITIMLGVSGCMDGISKVSPKEEMMTYMKNKYGEEFEFVNIGTETWDSSYTEMLLHSKKFPQGRILVRKSGSKITDNYTDFLMKGKIEEEMNSIVKQIYPQSKVLYSPGGMTHTNDINHNMSIREYSKSRLVAMGLTICIDDKDYKTNKDEKIEKLRKLLEEKEYRCNLYVFYVLEGKLYLINDNNIGELFDNPTSAKWGMMSGYFDMDNAYKFRSSRWEEIK